MSTRKNTHLHIAASLPTDQSLQESIFYPAPQNIKNKKSAKSQINKTYKTDKKRALGGNRASCPAR